MLTTQYGRPGHFARYEYHYLVAPGVWDVEDPQRITVTDDVNRFLDERGASLLDYRVDYKLVENQNEGRRRGFLVIASFTYLPPEKILDARGQQTTFVADTYDGQTQGQETAPAASAIRPFTAPFPAFGGGPAPGGGGGSRGATDLRSGPSPDPRELEQYLLGHGIPADRVRDIIGDIQRRLPAGGGGGGPGPGRYPGGGGSGFRS